MARYFMSILLYFHEPKVSVKCLAIIHSGECSKLFILYLISLLALALPFFEHLK